MAETLLISLYVISFFGMAAMPNRKSLAATTIAVGAPLAGLWLYIALRADEDMGRGAIFFGVLLIALTAGAVFGAIARGLMLLRGWSALRAAGALTSIACLLAGPGCVAGMLTAYDAWGRGPPSAACVARASFDIVIDEVHLRVPAAPFLRVLGSSRSYWLEKPQELKGLCIATDRHGGRIDARALTLVLGTVASEAERPAMRTWVSVGCPRADPALARLACQGAGSVPIDYVAIYGKNSFEHRIGSFGYKPSLELFRRLQTEGKYPSAEAVRHGSSLVYPGGVWVLDDSAAVFFCSPDQRRLICSGDIVLTPRLFAKMVFAVGDGDVERTYTKVRDATKALYADLAMPADASR